MALRPLAIQSNSPGSPTEVRLPARRRPAAEGGLRRSFVCVDRAGFEQHRPATFATLLISFRERLP